MNEALLELREITKAYRKGTQSEIKVLSGVDLSISCGETVALVAPSGAGKSTLLHIAGLLDTPDKGDVLIEGKLLSGISDSQRTQTRRRALGFVYQFHHLLPEFNALENIILPQYAEGVAPHDAKARATALLEQVGLADRAEHRPAQLSGGEAQRVAFCRALANEPKLLLADEPTGNLDPATSKTVFEMLVKIVKQTGLSALIATHNMELAAQMDRQIQLEFGKIRDVTGAQIS